ncbi:hypothetical protein Tco_0393236 [Tanacetum coccineum]
MSFKIDLLSFIQTADPTKVRVGERQRAEDEPKLLDTTVGCVIALLPIAPARAESELDASVNRLFDEGGSGNLAEQGDSASGRHVVGIPLVSEAVETVVEDVAPLQPKRQRKRKTIVSDAGGPSHPPKKLKEDHGPSTGPSVTGKSMSALQRLLAGAVLNLEVRIAALPTLPFPTSFVSVTLERENEDQTDSMALYSVDDSGHYRGFSDLTSSEFIIGGIRTVINPNTDLQKVYVPQWSVTNGSRLDDGRTCREMVDEFAPPKFFALIRGMDHDQLFTEFNVRAARQMSLSFEVRMHAEYNIKERRRLNSIVEEKSSLLKARDAKIESLKAQLLVKEAKAAKAIRLCAEASNFEAIDKSLQGEVRVLKDYNTTLEKEKSELDMKVADLVASVKVREEEATDLDDMVTSVKSQNDNLVDQVHELETSSAELQEKVAAYENCMGKLEEFQDEQIRVMNDKFKKLYVDFVEMSLHLEEIFYPRLLTTIAGRRWLLTYGVKLAIVKCLHSPEYLSALGAAISRAIEKGMQDGLAAGITHGQEGAVLTDIAAFNPSAESDYIFALQELQDVNFSLLAELKSNKDASTETLMNILCLDEPLAKRLGLDESQPHVDQLSAIRDVCVPLVEPLSSAALEGMESTSGTVPETTTALSVTFAYTSSILPISTDDYDVHADGQEGTGTDGQAGAGADVNPFPDVKDAELDIS